MGKNKIGVEQNPPNGKWDVGWLDDEEFTPAFSGYATKEEAEAQIPGFDARLENEMQEHQDEKDAEERAQNQLWPNIALVRERIKRMKNLRAAIDAQGKLDSLLDMGKHEHIGWPLPSWKAIKEPQGVAIETRRSAMNRSERRRIDRKMRKIMGKDGCSFCGRKFPHNSRITAGLAADEAVIACEQEQCIRSIEKIYALGLQSDRKYDLFGKGGGSGKHIPAKEAFTAIATTQQVIGNADKRFSAVQRSGVKQEPTSFNLLDSAWKDDDRAWFEQNPTRTHRIRPLYPDEDDGRVPPLVGHDALVLVRQIEPGLRAKRSFYFKQQMMLPVPDGEGGEEALAHALFDMVDNGESLTNTKRLFALIDRYRAGPRAPRLV